MKLHANAALSWSGRRLLAERVLVQGWTLTAAAEAAGVSVRCARKWVARYRAGDRQLLDRYQRWRSLDALSVAFATDSLTRIYGIPGETASAVRRLGMGLVGRISPLRNRLMSEARGTSGELPLLLRGLPI